jgi:hypothetical protein
MGWWLAAIVAIDIAGFAILSVILRNRIDRARSPEAGLEELRQEIGRIIVELNQVTDRNVRLLEDKAAALNELLATADKKMSLLRREIERHEVGSRLYDRLAGARPPEAVPEERDTRTDVLRLHRAGLSARIIASRVEMPLGEVELIISLGAS